MRHPFAIVSVINDLVSDQRVHRTALTLKQSGYKVLLVGRKRKSSPPLPPREYATHRMILLFEKGPLFYAEFNLRLFLFLLIHRESLLVSNDLDTLLPNRIVQKLKKIPLVYDAHEYFTGVPELETRPFVQKIWKKIERKIIPSIQYMVTVNDSIAALYNREYGVEPLVVRNIPLAPKPGACNRLTREDMGLPEGKRIILLQGAGINVNRGAEEAVLAMRFIEEALLLIIGEGDVIPALKSIVEANNLSDKVRFMPRQPFEQLYSFTLLADIGITFDKGTNLNYRFSLPNKLFDYLQAGLPVLASPLPEIKKIIDRFGCGAMIESHDPKHIATSIIRMLNDEPFLKRCRENALKAAAVLNGETEQLALLTLFQQIIRTDKTYSRNAEANYNPQSEEQTPNRNDRK
ncbi:MAG: glycosyltransferase [Bacteroidota bacterium]|nr:glycosyltransferase [Bacteroidota bacterium]